MRGGTPESLSKGGRRVAAERRRARAERSEAVDDAMVGHIEKLSAIMGQLVDEAGGEQYRCTCGVLGPKVSKMGLKDAAAVVQMLMTALKEPGDMATIVPIQIIVESGRQLVPNPIPAKRAEIPTTGRNP